MLGVIIMRITKDQIIKVAASIADQSGLHKVSLKTVAEELTVRSPSLYNHIENLDTLLHEVARKGMKDMNQQLMEAAVGSFGDAAIHNVAQAYLQFLVAHPGIYECIQWAQWQRNEKTDTIFTEYQSLLEKLLLTCGFKKEVLEAITALLMGFLHGYITMHLGIALQNIKQVQQDLDIAMDTILLGVHTTYDEK
jgi:AcrR family transcriptional regulator